MARCPRCQENSPGWFKLCARCKQENLLTAQPKDPKRPIKEPED